MRSVIQFHPLPGPNMSPVATTAVYPIQITTSSMPDATNGVFYTATLTAIGGVAPYLWSLLSGTLPPGLSLSSAGVISGTPTTSGIYNFAVQVTDMIGNSAVLNVGVGL
jgi:hypothetical protein